MNFIHNHLAELVILVPIILLLGIMGTVQYMNKLYAAMIEEEKENVERSFRLKESEIDES